VHHAAPDALPIVCCRFSEELQWLDLTETGIFHLLRYPFALEEVRQTFGFVQGARRRRRSLRAKTDLVAGLPKRVQDARANAIGIPRVDRLTDWAQAGARP